MTGCSELSGKLAHLAAVPPTDSRDSELAALSWRYRQSSKPASQTLQVVLTHCDRATEMDVTMIGLQNAGKTSLLRVLSVREPYSGPEIDPKEKEGERRANKIDS